MQPELRESPRYGLDAVGIFLVFLLVVAACSAAYAALELGWFRSPWEMAGWLVAGLAFIGAGVGIQSQRAPKNTNVYGAAQPATEAEAQAAARGHLKSTPLHNQSFTD
jgi:hypothetical protein